MFVATNDGLCNLANAIKITPLHRGVFPITFVDETGATIRCGDEEIARAVAPVVPAAPGTRVLALTHDFNEEDDLDCLDVEFCPIVAWRLRADQFDPEPVLVRPGVARGLRRPVGFAVLYQSIRPLIGAWRSLGHPRSRGLLLV